MMASWKRLVQPTDKDSFLKDGKHDDIVITIMGPTGAGKSTFINRFFGKKVAIQGDSLKSCTQQIAYYEKTLKEGQYGQELAGRRVILVDTPGFNDSFQDETEILRRIAVWLASSYTQEMNVAGVIYLTDISQKRMYGSALMNLKMFEKLCGTESFKKVMMVTTHWDDIPENVGAKREAELREVFYKTALAHGAVQARIDKPDAVRLVVDDIIMKHVNLVKAHKGEIPPDGLQLQKELVDFNRIIPATEAGKQLKYSLQEYLNMKKEAEADPAKQQELELKKQQLAKQIKELKIPFALRIMMFFGLA